MFLAVASRVLPAEQIGDDERQQEHPADAEDQRQHEKYAGHVASSPARFALVPSSPSCAARPGSRTIHMNSAMPRGPIASTASVAHVTLAAAELHELGGENLTEHQASPPLDEAPLLVPSPVRARK